VKVAEESKVSPDDEARAASVVTWSFSDIVEVAVLLPFFVEAVPALLSLSGDGETTDGGVATALLEGGKRTVASGVGGAGGRRG
jgi:hypothetical protein